jgi:hypothetical protein
VSVNRRLEVVLKLGKNVSPDAQRIIAEVRNTIVSGGPFVQVVLDVIASKPLLGPAGTKSLILLLMSLEAQMHGQKTRSDYLLVQAEAALA